MCFIFESMGDKRSSFNVTSVGTWMAHVGTDTHNSMVSTGYYEIMPGPALFKRKIRKWLQHKFVLLVKIYILLTFLRHKHIQIKEHPNDVWAANTKDRSTFNCLSSSKSLTGTTKTDGNQTHEGLHPKSMPWSVAWQGWLSWGRRYRPS